MLALVTIFIFTILVSVTAIWSYRKIAGWHGFTHTVMGRPGPTMRLTVRAQQGFITLNPAPRGQTRILRLRSPIGGIKAPWGW